MPNYISENDDIKKYTIVLLSLLDELVLVNHLNDEYTIPLYFGQSNRRVARKDSVHDTPYPKYSQILPAMHLSIEDYEINDIRQTNKFLKRKMVDVNNDSTQYMLAWNDINVDINFNLKIRAKNIEEMLRISEYLTSVFLNGKYYVDVKHILYDEDISTPIILNTKELDIELNEDVPEANREVESNLSFTVKGLFTNNIRTMSKKILSAKLRLWKEEQFENIIKEYNVEVI